MLLGPPLVTLKPTNTTPLPELELAHDASSLDFLRTVYRDPYQPMQQRMRAAIAALPFENPKLAVTATIGPDSGFAARLEAAVARSGKLIEHKSAFAACEKLSVGSSS